MSYKNAEEILPGEVIELIQQYVDGQNIYIPRKAEYRRSWGQGTAYKEELRLRNRRIRLDRAGGMSLSELAEKYHLSEKSISRVLREAK